MAGKTGAALCWYDEDPALLRQCVGSLAGFIDVLVAVDGPYGLWERQDAFSSPDEREALKDACRRVGIQFRLVGKSSPWSTQVAKRSYAIAAAGDCADWVMPLDSDWTLHGDPDEFRANLGAATGDSGIVHFQTPAADDIDHFPAWHRQTAGTTMDLPLVYRSLPGLRVERFHWGYVADKDGQPVGLWDTFYPPVEQFDTGLSIVHHCFERDGRKVAENARYIDERARLTTWEAEA